MNEYQVRLWNTSYKLEASRPGVEPFAAVVSPETQVEIKVNTLTEDCKKELLNRSAEYLKDTLTAAATGTESQAVEEIDANGGGIQDMAISDLKGTVIFYGQGDSPYAEVKLSGKMEDLPASFQYRYQDDGWKLVDMSF